METIYLFFAGQTKLEQERERIKALANDMSAISNGARVIEYDYDIDDKKNGEVKNQDRYNDFIRNKADIFIGVLTREAVTVADEANGMIPGQKTKSYTIEEIGEAIASYEKKGRPTVRLYYPVKEGFPRLPVESNDKNINRIKAFKERNHFTPYNSIETLEKDARVTIEQCIKKRRKKRFWRFLIAGILSLGIILTTLAYLFKPKDSILLIAGGGSVANYIKVHKGVDIDQRENTVTLRMPSDFSLVMLSEEVNRANSPDSLKSQYTPVCMSARKATIDDFTKVCTKEEIEKELRIIEYKLGTDSLAIYINNLWYNDITDHLETLKNGLPAISTDLLSSVLNEEEEYTVFATSVNSGTRDRYHAVIETVLSSGKEIHKFHEHQEILESQHGDKYLVLGSLYYPPKNFKDNDPESELKRVFVVDSTGQVLLKELSLYFPAFDNGSIYRIEKPVIDLLNDLGYDRWEENKIDRKKGTIDIQRGELIYNLK